MIKAIIVDDDELCRTVISDLLKEVDGFECIANFGNALDAFKFLNENEVDVVFLDVEMPKMGGMELLRNLQISPLIVMITSHDEFALESYEYDVTDFLKKPLSTSRFLKTIEKIKKLLGEAAEVKKKILLKKDGKFAGTCASNNPMFQNEEGECSFCGAKPDENCKSETA